MDPLNLFAPYHIAQCRPEHARAAPRVLARTLASVAILGASTLAAGCIGNRTLTDPTLEIRTERGTELGVATDYGVVFLGRTAQSGPIEITAMYGDGPDIEASVIEPIGGGLYTAETEIRLPRVTMSFDVPTPGTDVLVVGRNSRGDWKHYMRVVSDPRVLGILLPIPSDLEDAPDQIGAGVYVVPEGADENSKRLLGLVSGRITLKSKTGEHSYVAVVGPEDLWRLVVHRRDLLQRRRWVYRQDIL
jgi:hypothetical protein